MSDERVTPEVMLESALVQLEAAEALEGLIRVAVSDHHQPVGALVEAVTRRVEWRGVGDPAREFLANPEFVRIMDDDLLDVAGRSAELLARLRNLLSGRDRQPARGDLAKAVRAFPGGTVVPDGAVLPVPLSQGEAASLVESLAAMAADDGTRGVRTVRYRGLALVQVCGSPATPGSIGGPPLRSEGLVGAAAGVLNRRTDGRALAEIWLPLGDPRPQPVALPPPAAPTVRTALLVGWVAKDEAGKALALEVGRRSGCDVQVLPSNGALLAADEVGPFSAAVIRVHDRLDAAVVAATMRDRGPRLGIGLGRNCDHPEHRAEPAAFDHVFTFPFDPVAAIDWLVGLRRAADA